MIGQRLRWLVVTGLGAGASPLAPGTAGSALAIGVVILLDACTSLPWWYPAVLAAVASILCVLLGPWISARWQKQDPGAVVIDELAGQWVAVAVMLRSDHLITTYVAAFFLFRLLDILKPFGIRRLERLPLGWGVLLDDLAAGALTWGIPMVALPLL